MDLSDAVWGSREEFEFKLGAKLYSNSCCESLVLSVDLYCVSCNFFFLNEISVGVTHLKHIQNKHYLCCEDREEKFSPIVILCH